MKGIHMTEAKPILLMLTSKIDLRDEIISEFRAHIGGADYIGPWHPFTHTNYYAQEMGEGLMRCMVSFERVISPDEITSLKSKTKEIEDKYRMEGRRTVNLDPGYLDLHKFILASGKGGGHMLMISKNVFVDLLLWYNKGWQPLPWSYPDFKDGTYFKDLDRIRKKLKG